MMTRGHDHGLYRYRELDSSNEVERAVRRMEDRALEPASARMFDRLVRPLVERRQARVLEVGCGTGALSRRLASCFPEARVYATDKSVRMVSAGRDLGGADLPNLVLEPWDVTEADEFPFGAEDRFDLILSSVMMPYLAPGEACSAISDLSARLRPGGTLAFVEQDLSSDSLHFPNRQLVTRIFAKDERVVVRHASLGLRELLRAASLELLERVSFLWTEETYGPYLKDLLHAMVADALAAQRVDCAEYDEFLAGLDRLERRGEFYYGLVYHRIAGRRTH